MHRSVAGPLTKKVIGHTSISIPVIPWSRVIPAKQLLFASVEHEKTPVPHCGCQMVDMLVLDGRDERLKFLGLDGILTATCCPNCVGFLKGPAFNSFTLDGGTEVFPQSSLTGRRRWIAMSVPEDYKTLTENPFVLGRLSVPLFFGWACEDVNTVGGFANWVQDAEYTTCPTAASP